MPTKLDGMASFTKKSSISNDAASSLSAKGAPARLQVSLSATKELSDFIKFTHMALTCSSSSWSL
jgi:hypothetical protein